MYEGIYYLILLRFHLNFFILNHLSQGNYDFTQVGLSVYLFVCLLAG